MTATLIDRHATIRREVVAPDELRRVWQRVAAADPTLLPEQTPEWVDAICASGRYENATRLYSSAEGRQFVFPLVRRRGLAGAGGRFNSFPSAWGIGGVVGEGLTSAVVAAIVDDLRSMHALTVTVRIDPKDDPYWNGVVGRGVVAVARRAHVMDLPPDSDVHYRAMARSARKALRTAERHNVQVKIVADGSLLGEHYQLFMKSVERWARHQHEPVALARWRARRRDPIEKLRAMSEFLGSRMITGIAYVNDQPAASSIVMLSPTARETRAAMDVDLAARPHAAYAVQWATIEAARRFGSHTYNMGESGHSDGISFFKERFGAVAVEHSEYHIERLPLTSANHAIRSGMKRLIGFRDT
jgi:hypothetical protein